jgi:hypothetical protein
MAGRLALPVLRDGRVESLRSDAAIVFMWIRPCLWSVDRPHFRPSSRALLLVNGDLPENCDNVTP